MGRTTFIIGIALFLCLSSVLGDRREATKDVLSILRDSSRYDKEIPPFNSSGGPVDVSVKINLRELDEDEINMQISVDMTLRMEWRDSRLAYNSFGVPFVTLSNPKLAWLPEPIIKNSVSSREVPDPQDDFLRITPEGDITYVTRKLPVIRCKLSGFAHGIQKCRMSIASYGFTDKEVSYKFVNRGGFSASMSIKNLLGYITSNEKSRSNIGNFSSVDVAIILLTELWPYALQFYIPVISLVVLAVLSEFVVRTEFLSRVLLNLVPLITVFGYSIAYSQMSTAQWPNIRSIDVFSVISFMVIFCQLVRVIVIHLLAQRNDNDEEDPNKSSESRLGKLLVKASLISYVILAVLYVLFLMIFFIVNTPSYDEDEITNVNPETTVHVGFPLRDY